MAVLLLLDLNPRAEKIWRGLVVAPEHRCSPYNQRDYHYPQSVEPQIVAEIGKVYGPYTGRCFASRDDTDISTSSPGPRPTTADSARPMAPQDAASPRTS